MPKVRVRGRGRGKGRVRGRVRVARGASEATLITRAAAESPG
jgi:hypothetical protein